MQEIINALQKSVDDLMLENTNLKQQLKFEQIKNAKNKQIIAGLLDENISHASHIELLNADAAEKKAVADALANEKKTEQLEELKKDQENCSPKAEEDKKNEDVVDSDVDSDVDSTVRSMADSDPHE